MKKILPAVSLVVALAISGYAQKAAAGKIDPTSGVHAAFDRLVEGITQVDANKVMSVYEKSPDLLIFNNNGTATKGWDNIRSNVEKLYPKIKNVTHAPLSIFLMR